MKERIAAALRDAKDLMNDKGAHWVRHDLRSPILVEDGVVLSSDYAYCALGAIYKVTGVDLDKIHYYDTYDGNSYKDGEEAYEAPFEGDADFRRAVIDALYHEIIASGFEPPDYKLMSPTGYDKVVWSITNWNDRGERTWEDVASMFESAASSVEDKEEHT